MRLKGRCRRSATLPEALEILLFPSPARLLFYKALYRRCRSSSLGASPLSAAQGQAFGFGSPHGPRCPKKVVPTSFSPYALHTSLRAARQGLWRLFCCAQTQLKEKNNRTKTSAAARRDGAARQTLRSRPRMLVRCQIRKAEVEALAASIASSACCNFLSSNPNPRTNRPATFWSMRLRDAASLSCFGPSARRSRRTSKPHFRSQQQMRLCDHLARRISTPRVRQH
ncbi:hypothetical protein ACVIGB_008251 [Bradyrhizobium sp. USDA 4341]